MFDHEIFLMQAAGGVSRYFIELIKGLTTSGVYNPVVFAGFHQSTLLRNQGRSLSARIIGAKIPFNVSHSRTVSIFNQLAFRFFVRRFRPDIYHATYYRAVPTGTRTARVVTIHDMIAELYFSDSSHPDPTPARKRRAISDADSIICVSAHTRRDMMSLYPDSGCRSFVVYHGASLPSSEIRGSLIDEPYFLYVGQRDQRKNHELVKQAFEQANLTACRLVFFGGAKPTREEIADGALRRHVYVPGNDEDLATWYSHAEALLYPSRYEGFGMPILEAMSVGCPVVAANTSSIPEVAGNACVLLEPSNRKAWATVLRELHTSLNFRSSLAARGIAHSKQFSWDRCAMETARVYRHAQASRLNSGFAITRNTSE